VSGRSRKLRQPIFLTVTTGRRSSYTKTRQHFSSIFISTQNDNENETTRKHPNGFARRAGLRKNRAYKCRVRGVSRTGPKPAAVFAAGSATERSKYEH